MRKILACIVLAQFLCTSLWFAGNAVFGDIAKQFSAGNDLLPQLTSTVQLGFIAGTLVFAILSIADRFSPSRVFFCSAAIAAICNLLICVEGISLNTLIAFRFLTGFFLAGIYPVGMKITADYYEKGLGKSLGLLLGALVLGTALPHLLKAITVTFPWRYVMYCTSVLAIAGGLIVLIYVPDGPFRKAGQKPSLTAFMEGFRHPGFRAAAFGYFGHMWELYAFWTFVPVMIANFEWQYSLHLNISLLSFMVIGIGSVACICSGLLSRKSGEYKVATISLAGSGICCMLSPLIFHINSSPLFVLFLLIWGIFVVADSPLFSTLIAKYAHPERRGASLTIVNCIGFSITVVSIQLLRLLITERNYWYIFLILSLGPILGVISLIKKQIRPQLINETKRTKNDAA